MSDVDDLYTVDGDSVVLAVHVQPRAGRSAILGREGRALKLRVAAPPVDDRANEAARALLAEELGVAPSAVELAGGARSRQKRFRVRDIDREELDTQLRRVLRGADSTPGPRSRLRGD
ncbi:MAG TPA: DUF167 domain-containing protein [Acidimicrobiia bacterium]|nr:DUF167 domain-containing protein [Acidimicrobiia bacterium]